MRRPHRLAALSILAGLTITASPALAQRAARATNPQIEIDYRPPRNASFRPIYEQLAARKVLETLQQFLAPLQLPRKLVIRVDECGGAITTAYKPDGPVTICYEYIADIERLAPKSTVHLQQADVTVGSAKTGPFVQAVLHAIALATFDILKVPVWGRLDDAADRVSALILLNFGPDVALYTIIGTAWFLAANTTAPLDFADERGVMAQRYYTVLCLAYGRDPQTFARFVAANRSGLEAEPAAGDLPSARAGNCRTEYNIEAQAFRTTIMPRLDQALVKRVQEDHWLDLRN